MLSCSCAVFIIDGLQQVLEQYAGSFWKLANAHAGRDVFSNGVALMFYNPQEQRWVIAAQIVSSVFALATEATNSSCPPPGSYWARQTCSRGVPQTCLPLDTAPRPLVACAPSPPPPTPPLPPSSPPQPPLSPGEAIVYSAQQLLESIADASLQQIWLHPSGSPYQTSQTLVIERFLVIASSSDAHVTIDGQDQHRVVWIKTGAVVTMERLIITGGNIGDETFTSIGAGIFNEGARLSLLSCQIIENRIVGDPVLGRGGGIAHAQGELIMVSSRVARNHAVRYAGGLVVYSNTQASLTNCSVEENHAERAAGIFVSGAYLTVTGTRVCSNNATLYGGGLYNDGSSGTGRQPSRVDITDSIVCGNSALLGGGLFNHRGAWTELARSHVIDNVARSGGGSSDGGGGAGVYNMGAPDAPTAAHAPAGQIFLLQSLLLNNSGEADKGANVYSAGQLSYVLPAPVGYFVTGSFACRETVGALLPPQICNFSRFSGQQMVNVSIEDGDFPVPCASGFYGNSSQRDHQTTPFCSGMCPPGHFCSLSATVEPVRCPPGSFAASPGTQLASDCTACTLGAFCLTGAVQPQMCDPGMFQDEQGAAECKPCRRGHYCPQGASTELPCEAGSYSNETYRGDQCILCDEGHFCPVGSEEQVPCAPGTYSSVQGAESCLLCSPGEYQDEPGNTTCKACPNGYYCGAGAGAALPCPAGRRTNASMTMTSSDDCIVCPAGTSCSVGSSESVACLPGSFAAQPEQASCTLCPPGSYQDEHGQTGCKVCYGGAYCAEGAATPVPCEGGTYGNGTGLSSENECVWVETGFWAPTGSVTPQPCFSGFYCPGRANDGTNGGALPLQVEVGSMQEEIEIAVVEQEITLDITCDDYNHELVKQEFATLYQVPLQLIEISDPCSDGSQRRRLEVHTHRQLSRHLQSSGLAIMITIRAASADGSSSSVNVSTVLSTVNAVSDSALGSVLSSALNVSLVVSANPPVQEVQRTQIQADCPAGYWCTAGFRIECEADTYQPNVNGGDTASACLPCMENAGTSGLTARTSYADCQCNSADGFVEGLDALGNRTCFCETGSYAVVIPGTVVERCERCATGSYKDTQGNELCTACTSIDPLTTTTATGSTSPAQCVCKEDYFDAGISSATHTLGARTRDCVLCAVGTACEGAVGATMLELPVSPGYWRARESSPVVYPCWNERFCVGGTKLNATCKESHKGPFCELCVAEYYANSLGDCVPCGGDAMLTYAVGGGVMGGFIIALIILLCGCCSSKRMDPGQAIGKLEQSCDLSLSEIIDDPEEAVLSTISNNLEQALQVKGYCSGRGQAWCKNCCKIQNYQDYRKIIVEFKIIASLLQVLASLKLAFDIPFPPLYTTLIQWLSLLELNFFDVMPLSCTFPGLGFHFVLVVYTLAPLLLLAVALMIFSLIQMKIISFKWKATAERLFTACYLFVFIVAPSNSMKLFAALSCTSIDGPPGETSFLKIDLSINCESEFHHLFEIYAWVFIVVWVFGVPVLLACLMYVWREKLRRLHNIERLCAAFRETSIYLKQGLQETPTREELEANARIEKRRLEHKIDALKAKERKVFEELPSYMQNLIDGYTRTSFWFEIFESLRKSAILCLPIVFESGSPEQLMLGLLVCFITFGLYTFFRPYSEPHVNILAQACQCQIFFALLSSIALKFATTATSDALDGYAEAHGRYTEVLDVLLCVLTVLPGAMTMLFTVLLRNFLNKMRHHRDLFKNKRHLSNNLGAPAKIHDSAEIELSNFNLDLSGRINDKIQKLSTHGVQDAITQLLDGSPELCAKLEVALNEQIEKRDLKRQRDQKMRKEKLAQNRASSASSPPKSYRASSTISSAGSAASPTSPESRVVRESCLPNGKFSTEKRENSPRSELEDSSGHGSQVAYPPEKVLPRNLPPPPPTGASRDSKWYNSAEAEDTTA